MPRLSSVTVRGRRRPRRGSPKGSLTIDAATAALVRRVCRHDGYDLTSFVDAMLQSYLREHHPDWPVQHEEPAR